MLSKLSNKETAKRLESEYNRLVHPNEMGEIYKVFYVGNEKNGFIIVYLDLKIILRRYLPFY